MKDQIESLNHANRQLKVKSEYSTNNLQDKEKFLENMDQQFKVKLES